MDQVDQKLVFLKADKPVARLFKVGGGEERKAPLDNSRNEKGAISIATTENK